MSLSDFKEVSLEQVEAAASVGLGGEHHVTHSFLCM